MTPIDRWLATLTRRSAGTADAELLGRYAVARDGEAFAELVRRYGPLVLGVCRRRVPDGYAAEDAFQAVFVVLAAKAGRIDATRPLGPWLHGVAVKVAARAGRRLAQRRRREVGVRDLPEVAVTRPSPDDATAVLDEELARLSATYREALVLCELEGLSRRAAAGRLGIAEGTLSSRLAAGRKDLARRLARRGVGPLTALVGASVSPGLAEAATRIHARVRGRSRTLPGGTSRHAVHETQGPNVYVLDLATGQATRIGDEARLVLAKGRWSPDGKRVAYAWREWAKDAAGVVSAAGVPPTRLVVRDADGKNPKTLVTSDEVFRVVAWE